MSHSLVCHEWLDCNHVSEGVFFKALSITRKGQNFFLVVILILMYCKVLETIEIEVKWQSLKLFQSYLFKEVSNYGTNIGIMILRSLIFCSLVSYMPPAVKFRCLFTSLGSPDCSVTVLCASHQQHTLIS